MRRLNLAPLALVILLSATGCAHRAGLDSGSDGARFTPADDARWALFMADAPQSQPAASQPTSAPTTQPARMPFSMPGAAYRAVDFLGVAALGAAPQIGAAGREFSQSAFAGDAAVGAAGLTAPQTFAQGVVGSRGGLVQGALAGLFFDSPGGNLFTSRFNALTGPGGRCNELAAAGFFTSPVACQAHFSGR